MNVNKASVAAWIVLGLCGGGLGLPGASRAQASVPVQPPDPLTLSWCLQEASERNPDIAVDQATAEAAEHRIGPAGSLDDPRFKYEASNVPLEKFDFNSTPMSGNQLGLSQKFPFPGVLSNRREAARAGYGAATSSLEDRKRRVASAVETSYAELGFAQRALEITDENIELLRQIEKVAEKKYEVGEGLQQDVLRAQVELSLLLDEQLRRKKEIATAGARLNALLDRPAGAHLPRTEQLRDTTPLPHITSLFERLDQVSPRLKALVDQIDQAERLRKASIREGYPDFDVGLGYRIRSNVAGDPVAGEDFVGAGVTIRLPLNRRKWHEIVAERGSLVRRAKAAYRSEQASLREQLQSSYADLKRADDEIKLLETGLVPQARQSLESSRAGYEVNKVDFLSLLNSETRLLDVELRLVRAYADKRAAFAALEAAFGEALR